MKSKVLLFALAATALTLTTKAQDKTTFGIRAGVNFTNLNGEIGGHDLENKIKAGFNIGVNAEIPVAPEFYLQPGLLFTTKGAKADEGDDKTNVSYLEIPINFLYKPALGPGKMLLGFGPYVGIGIGGKVKGDGADVDIKFKNDISVAEYTDLKTDYTKRLDFGGNLLVGYELSSKISFQLNAQLGMANLVPKVEGKKLEDTKVKNTGFGFSIGYRF
jgi:hypothetical protein